LFSKFVGIFKQLKNVRIHTSFILFSMTCTYVVHNLRLFLGVSIEIIIVSTISVSNFRPYWISNSFYDQKMHELKKSIYIIMLNTVSLRRVYCTVRVI